MMIGLGLSPCLSGSRLDGSTAALLAAMTTKPTGAQTADIDTLIRGLKADGLWTLIDGLWVLVAHDAQAARINWKTPASVASAVGSPTFTTNAGYAFDGVTNYLNLLFVPSTDKVAATATSLSIGVYERTNVGVSGARAMGTSGSATISLVPRTASNSVQLNLLSGLSGAGAATTTDSRGLTVAQTDGTNSAVYRAGSFFGSGALASPSATFPSVALFAGGYNAAGSLTSPRASTLGLVLTGAGLDATQHANLNTRVQTYMTARGANV